MKPSTHSEMYEGPDAFRRFENLVKSVISTPREAIQDAVQEHREKAKQNPRKRGPKTKR